MKEEAILIFWENCQSLEDVEAAEADQRRAVFAE